MIRIRKHVLDLNVDAILVTDPANIFYWTNFSGSGSFLILQDKFYLFTDSRYMIAAEKAASVLSNLEVSTEDVIEFMKKNNVKKLGIEDLKISQHSYLQKHFELVFVKDVLQKERMVKTEQELDKIRKAYSISEKALKSVLNSGVIYETEKEIAARLNYEFKLKGAEKESFDTIVAFKKNSAMPHAKPSGKKIIGSGFLKIDFGCIYEGYCSDTTRTFYIGKASKKEKKIYMTVLEAHLLGVSLVREGITFQEIDTKVREYIKSKGFEPFQHSLGHGLGIEVHENPFVNYDKPLIENMVITIEPGIYIQGLGGVRIEDGVIVRKDRGESLNSMSKEFKEIN